MMRRVRYPMTLFALTGGRLTPIGSSCVELIEWTHADETKTHLAPYTVR